MFLPLSDGIDKTTYINLALITPFSVLTSGDRKIVTLYDQKSEIFHGEVAEDKLTSLLEAVGAPAAC